jgi:hypothetical protein
MSVCVSFCVPLSREGRQARTELCGELLDTPDAFTTTAAAGHLLAVLSNIGVLKALL